MQSFMKRAEKLAAIDTQSLNPKFALSVRASIAPMQMWYGYLRNDEQALTDGLNTWRATVRDLREAGQTLDAVKSAGILANNLAALGEQRHNVTLIDEGVAMARRAVEDVSHARDPEVWSKAQYLLGLVLYYDYSATKCLTCLEQSVAALRESLKEQAIDKASEDRPETQKALAKSLMALGAEHEGIAEYKEAAQLYQTMLGERGVSSGVVARGYIQVRLGDTLMRWNERDANLDRTRTAIALYREGLRTLPDTYGIRIRSNTQMNLGDLLLLSAKAECSRALADEALGAYTTAAVHVRDLAKVGPTMQALYNRATAGIASARDTASKICHSGE